jgi:hypothetical protein
MNSVIINAKIREKKKAEFFHTSEALEPLLKKYCSRFEININSKQILEISIVFDSEKQSENYSKRDEFNILKGLVKGLCEDVVIKIDNVPVN